jgi:3',5'-cyclic AMP phosphodiesterase CpdA
MDVHTFLFWRPRHGILLLAVFFQALSSSAQVTIAQISDTHIGEKHSPHAVDNLRHAVEMINARRPDAVVLSGDIGENPKAWETARSTLRALKAPLYYVPGNHDVHSNDVERYRGVFGKDYYSFQIKNVTLIAIDSQLLANVDEYDAKRPQPLPRETEEEAERMMSWLDGFRSDGRARSDSDEGRESKVVIAVQHIPCFRDGNFPPDTKPYWVISDPYRSQEIKMLHELGIRDVLAGHWHNGRVFEREGITWHVAPATSWLPWGGELGFALHTISADGRVSTEFVTLPGARP